LFESYSFGFLLFQPFSTDDPYLSAEVALLELGYLFDASVHLAIESYRRRLLT
jgi:hypothetical protein